MDGGKKAGNKSKNKNLKEVEEKKGKGTADKDVKEVKEVKEERAAAGTATAVKKAGGKAKSRNPNLKLVKNGDAPVKKESSKGASSKESLTKEDSSKRNSSKGTSSKKKSRKAVSAKKDSAKNGSLREVPPKEDSPKRNSINKDTSKESAGEEASLKDSSSKDSSLGKSSAKNSSAKKSSAKKSSAKKSSTKKLSAKKSSVKEASAKKTSAKGTSTKEDSTKEVSAKEVSAKGAPLEEFPAQKTSPKKVSAGETSVKEALVKKALVKKATVKKAPIKKAPIKKASAKKSSVKQTFGKEISAEYDDKSYAMSGWGIGEWFIQHKSLVIIWLMVFAVIGTVIFSYRYIITNYRVTTVYVDGNVHYSNEEIMDMVMTGVYGNNSLYLAMKYKDKGVEGVPFVERMDVDILTPNTIRISVYEKALAGYVEYLGRYMYFDRDGIVVESSKEKTEGIPQVTGLQFGYVVLNEALPVENDGIFKRILSITQLLDKYELTADKIYFDSDYDLTLYFDGVRVTLGSSEEIDEKIMRLQYILPELSGKKGTLSMENYTEDTRLIPFHQD